MISFIEVFSISWRTSVRSVYCRRCGTHLSRLLQVLVCCLQQLLVFITYFNGVCAASTYIIYGCPFFSNSALRVSLPFVYFTYIHT